MCVVRIEIHYHVQIWNGGMGFLSVNHVVYLLNEATRFDPQQGLLRFQIRNHS